MLKINNKNKELIYKMVKYKDLKAGDVFLTTDQPKSRIDANQEYLKTLTGRVKLRSGSYENFEDYDFNTEEEVYLLKSELNLEKIIVND